MHIRAVMQGTGPAAVPVSPRVQRAAEEFEAQMMKELLQPLNESDGWGGADDETGSANALGSYSLEALGSAISRSGGIGIAREIVAHLSQSGRTSP